MDKEKFPEITIVKGISIIWIVLFHMYKDFPEIFFGAHGATGLSLTHFIMLGSLGVNLFVICSGFLLAYSSEKSVETASGFLFKRINKLIPLYYCAIIAVLGLDWSFGRSDFDYSILSIVLHLMCLHTLTEYLFDIQGAWWFMGLVFQLYIIFPVLNRSVNAGKYKAVIVMVLSLTVISRFINIANFNSNYSVFAFLPDFVAGILIYKYLWTDRSYNFRPCIVTFCFIAICMFLYIMKNNIFVFSYCYGLARPLISIGFFLILTGFFKYLRGSYAVKPVIIPLFGTYSYAIYLFHRPFIFKYTTVASHYLNTFFVIALYLSVMLVTGMILTKSEFIIRREIKKW